MTLEQAVKLAVGASPNFGRHTPASFMPLLEAAKQAIERRELPATTEIDGSEGRAFSLDATDKTKVTQADMRAWLKRKQVSGAFFFLLPPGDWPAASQLAATRSAARTWPWGNHETALLRALSKAAEEWQRYDSAMPASAPKNDAIVAILKEEKDARGQPISDNIAKAIATILRHDSVPDGPRTRKG